MKLRSEFVLAALLSTTGSQAIVEGPGNPVFADLLRSQPIVVWAADPGLVRREKEIQKAAPGDVDPHPASVQVFEYHRFHTKEVLKGELPNTFEVRVSQAGWIEQRLGKTGEAVLVLAPDYGNDPNRKKRSGFLVVHQALFAVYDSAITIPTEVRDKDWTLTRIRDSLAAMGKRRADRRAASPEPAEAAAVPVRANEDKPREEKPMGEAAETRPNMPLPEATVSRAAPDTRLGPGYNEPPVAPKLRPNRLLWILALAAIAVICLILLSRRKK